MSCVYCGWSKESGVAHDCRHAMLDRIAELEGKVTIDRKDLQIQTKASLINRIVEMSNAIEELEEMVSRLESERNRMRVDNLPPLKPTMPTSEGE